MNFLQCNYQKLKDNNMHSRSEELLEAEGKATLKHKNSWVTDFEITEENVEKIMLAARARWKIENECFNTLTNQGYNIEHSYGHGVQNSCFNYFLLCLIAFYFHQIFEMTDKLYLECRKKFMGNLKILY